MTSLREGLPLNIAQELERLRQQAVSVVYEIDDPTPLMKFQHGTSKLWLKREDLSRIRSYKWRGAYFKIKKCLDLGNDGPFVATSAGNHAQGVAVSAAKLKVPAKIFMPRTTPKLKQSSVLKQGGDFVSVELVGDHYEDTVIAASKWAAQESLTVINPFDDLDVIAGQSTVADEIQKVAPGLDVIFVPIGGGGLASGISYAMSQISPATRVVGVEVCGQDSMRRSIESGSITRLEEIDVFCDGTAVMEPGKYTFALCKEYLQEIVTVTNEQVCAAIQLLWEEQRVITEPSGAIALAGYLKAAQRDQGLEEKDCGAILSGGNTDFLTLPVIVKKSQLAQPTRCYYRFEIGEKAGSLISLLDLLFEEVNIVDFQYGKSSSDHAFPVLGLDATSEQQAEIRRKLKICQVPAVDVSQETTTLFRVIPFRPDLTQNPLFLHVDFPDRPGALRQLMRDASLVTNICYFNFNDTGQLQGHALIGFEFKADGDSAMLFELLNKNQFQFKIEKLDSAMGL